MKNRYVAIIEGAKVTESELKEFLKLEVSALVNIDRLSSREIENIVADSGQTFEKWL